MMYFFPNTSAESCFENNIEYKTISYNSNELSVDWTFREFQNQTIIFSRKVESSR